MLALLLAIGYPLLVHAAILTRNSWLEAASVLALAALLLALPMRAGRVWAWLLFAVTLGGAVLLGLQGGGRYFLYFPPVLLALLLLWLFARSLAPGRTALLTLLARRVHGVEQLALEHEAYSHRLTQFWCGVFICMALGNALLAAFAPAEIWSLFTNFLNYLLVGVIFLLEYVVRRRVLRAQPHPPFLRYLRQVVTADYRGMGRNP